LCHLNEASGVVASTDASVDGVRSDVGKVLELYEKGDGVQYYLLRSVFPF